MKLLSEEKKPSRSVQINKFSENIWENPRKISVTKCNFSKIKAYKLRQSVLKNYTHLWMFSRGLNRFLVYNFLESEWFRGFREFSSQFLEI